VKNYEAQLKRRDGSFFWIRFSAKLVKEKGWLEGVVEEITDLKRAEEEKSVIYNELLASEKKYRLIFEASPFGLFYVNSKGIIIDCNEAFINLSGLSWSTIVGISLFDLPDKDVIESAGELLQGKSGNYEGEYQFVESSKKIPLRIIYKPVFDSNGRVAGGVVIVEDITEKRITQRAVLDELEKERSRIGHILHDSLGQKLGAVLYLVQAFRRKYNKTGELSDDDIEQLSEVASSALEETRTLSRGLDFPLGKGGFVELLNDIVRKTVNVYGITVDVDVDASIVEHDPMKLSNLYYIILESINNALRHGKAKKIIIRYNNNREHNLFIIESLQSCDFIIDNPGMGIRIMKYRAEASGMVFGIDAKGKRVIVTVEIGDKNNNHK
jgi:PAS domain S-box-containing protein